MTTDWTVSQPSLLPNTFTYKPWGVTYVTDSQAALLSSYSPTWLDTDRGLSYTQEEGWREPLEQRWGRAERLRRWRQRQRMLLLRRQRLRMRKLGMGRRRGGLQPSESQGAPPHRLQPPLDRFSSHPDSVHLEYLEYPDSRGGYKDYQNSQRGYRDFQNSKRGYSDYQGLKRGYIDSLNSKRGYSDYKNSKRGYSDYHNSKRGYSDHQNSKRGSSDYQDSKRGYWYYEDYPQGSWARQGLVAPRARLVTR